MENLEKSFLKNQDVAKKKEDSDIENKGRRKFMVGAAAFVTSLATGIGAKEDKSNEEKYKGLTEQNKITEDNNKENVQEHKAENEKNIADHYLDAYIEIGKTEIWNKEIFTDELFIAQQLQESGYDIEAHSDKDAVGVMQVRPIAMVDVTAYLVKLKNKGLIKYDGPSELNEIQIEELKQLIKQKSDYGRAFGKMYMAMLADYKNGYGVAENLIKNKDFKKAQKEILATYNGGLGSITYRKKGQSRRRTRSEHKWPKESRDYYKKIFNYEKRIENIKNAYVEKGLMVPNNEEIKNIALKMDRYHNTKDRYAMLKKHVEQSEG